LATGSQIQDWQEVSDVYFQKQIDSSIDAGMSIALVFYMVYDLIPVTEPIKVERIGKDGVMMEFTEYVEVVPRRMHVCGELRKAVWQKEQPINIPGLEEWAYGGPVGVTDSAIPSFYTQAALEHAND
jgi:hypothetical protein